MNILVLALTKDYGHNLANALTDYGHVVTVDGLTLAKGHPLLKLYRMFRLILKQRGKHDVIIAETQLYDALAGLALARISTRKVSLIFYTMGFSPGESSETIPKAFRGISSTIAKWVMMRYDHIVYISKWLKDKYFMEAAIPGIEDKPFSIIHHAPHPLFLNQGKGDDEGKFSDGRTRANIEICYAGNFALWDKARGILLLLDALSQVLQNHPSVLCYIAGNGRYGPFLEEKANELNLADRVTFTGKLSQPALRKLYESSDIFVYPSFMDGCPTVVMEAQACGLPAIVTNSSGAAELVKDTITGLVCKPTVEELASSLTDLIVDPSKRKTMALQAREHIKRDLSWDVCAQKFNRLIDSLSAGRETMPK